MQQNVRASWRSAGPSWGLVTVAILAITAVMPHPAVAQFRLSAASYITLKPTQVIAGRPGAPNPVVAFTLNVTLSHGAPNCFGRAVVLVNGLFQPAIEVAQGDILQIRLINNIPASFPAVSDGISIHYHGLNMRGPAAWLDGVSYVTACPLKSGQEFVYQFRVDDPPGSYMWHDHAQGFKGEGLNGPLIVHPKRLVTPDAALEPLQPLPPKTPAPTMRPGKGPAKHAPPAAKGNEGGKVRNGNGRRLPEADLWATGEDLWAYDAEHILFLSDWYNTPTNSLLMRLNPPFDAAKATPNTGMFTWIGNPQSTLINGKGFYGDCTLNPGFGGGAAACSPSVFTVPPGRSPQQPWASALNPGCTHEALSLTPGKTYRLRLIASTTLVYLSVCFEGHNVTLISADAVPVDPIVYGPGQCVDVNSGQRMDVLLTADADPSRNYWITAVPQFRAGSPSGFGILRYAGQNATLPPTPARQAANTSAWTLAQHAAVHTLAALLSPANASYDQPAAIKYYTHGYASMTPPAFPARVVVVNLSQPLIESNGAIKWALNNVVAQKAPPCTPLLRTLAGSPSMLTAANTNVLTDSAKYNASTAGMVGIYVGEGVNAPTYVEGLSPVRNNPQIGTHYVVIGGGETIDVVINNGPANAFNGDYRPTVGAARTAQEQHPFHLHGHHFWVLGYGMGYFNASLAAGLNTINPAYRDTVTIPLGGWVVIRFVADNPGVWPLHCHILPHAFMGQQLFFAEDVAKAWNPAPPTPTCSKTCRYNVAPYAKDWVRDMYGSSGFEVPV